MAASLSSLELRPGRVRIPGMQSEKTDSGDSSSFGPFLGILVKAGLLIGGALAALLIIHLLRSPQGRRRILIFCGTCIVLFSLMHYIPWGKFQSQTPNLRIQGPIGDQGRLPPSAEAIIPNPPWWLVLMVSLALSALILGALLFFWRRLRRRANPLELVRQEVQKTLEELRAGADLEEGVIRCYFEMSQVLKRQRGFERQPAMTTREFETYLEETGLPGVHVRRLTRLFEKVRYGAKNLDELEDREAIACLTAIVQACEGSR